LHNAKFCACPENAFLTEALMHEEYAVERFEIEVAASGPTNQMGEVMFWYDTDVSDDNTFQYGNESAMTLAMSHAGNKLFRFTDGTTKCSFPCNPVKWFYPFAAQQSDERLVSPGNCYIMLVSDPASVYGSARAIYGVAADASGSVELGKVFINAKFRFRRPKAIEQYEDAHFSNFTTVGVQLASATDVLGNTNGPVVQVTGGPNSNMIVLDDNPAQIASGTYEVNMATGTSSAVSASRSSCALMLNAGASTPNPRVLQLTAQINCTGLASGSTNPALYLVYVVDGVTQTIQQALVNVINQGITWPTVGLPGVFAGTTAFVGQTTFQLFIPQGTLPATAGQPGSGARLYMTLFNVSPFTGGSYELDLMFSEVPFRPWDWDVPANSVSAMFVPRKWRSRMQLEARKELKFTEEKEDDNVDDARKQLNDAPSPGLLIRGALAPLVIDQDSPVVVSSSASKSRKAAGKVAS